jgi:hypothetical protein
MGFLNDTIIAANTAFNRIGGMARSYLENPNMLRAKMMATRVARSGLNAAKSTPAILGASAGAAAGAGYDYATNRRSNWRSMAGAGLKGAGMGMLGGIGYRGVMGAGGPRAIMGAARSRIGTYGAAARTGWSNMVAKAQSARGFGY